MRIISERFGKVLYGFLFVVVLPAFLIAWAAFGDQNVPLPIIGSPEVGLMAALIGAIMMAGGVIALRVYGDGLPMSPFPPKNFVAKGIYRYVAHPIYVGFSILCIGASIAAESASGLWLVSPVVILGCVALVQGFEKHNLARRFGSAFPKPLIRIPSNESGAPGIWDRLSVCFLVLFPWLILYEAVKVLGVPKDGVSVFLPFEKSLPVWEWTEAVYASAYVFVVAVPLVAGSRRALREFSIAGLTGTVITLLIFLAIPIVATPRPFVLEGFFGNLLMFERSKDTAAAAFPSFHVLWTLLAARVYAERVPSLRHLWWMWAILVSASCVTTGMHAIADVVGAVVVYFLATRAKSVWEFIRSSSEKFSNSWKEWRFGPVRIINHGIFAGIGTFIGVSIVGWLTGPAHVASVLIVAFSSLIISALWAQFIEGSPKLLRPYGYYGGVVGVIVGAFFASLLGTNVWLLLASFCVAGPWIQSFGRMRCLIQGCCHGHEASPEIGIRYTHPRSRVCRLANLSGLPIHPTPVYSILWNVVIAFVVTRLWFVHASFAFIAGMYLILTGLGRFVEEAYRGEPQTPVFGGLRLYQWIAILSVVAGAVLTALPATGVPYAPQFSWDSLAAGFGFGLFTWFALGVDFPDSNRRFARLA
ncbi:MAG: prolipoprotein diacylglyceryl transferase [Ignavibacteriales bacterium]|nr:prolipoprotein diacylglyceryl transferase [Ignavibacteriales bacterium]